jgi:hypothetical protein
MSIAGHVSQKMLQHYSHMRMQAKRTALDALDLKQPKPLFGNGYSTNHSTKRVSNEMVIPQIIDSMVELSGIEPLTSSLRTRRSPS